MNHSQSFNDIVAAAKQNINEITIEEVKKLQSDGADFVLVDTREDTEWAKGHIDGAIHIGKGVIERDIEKHIPDHAKQIVLYCGGGSRSALAAENLQRMGYSNVYSMIGGYRGWE